MHLRFAIMDEAMPSAKRNPICGLKGRSGKSMVLFLTYSFRLNCLWNYMIWFCKNLWHGQEWHIDLIKSVRFQYDSCSCLRLRSFHNQIIFSSMLCSIIWKPICPPRIRNTIDGPYWLVLSSKKFGMLLLILTTCIIPCVFYWIKGESWYGISFCLHFFFIFSFKLQGSLPGSRLINVQLKMQENASRSICNFKIFRGSTHAHPTPQECG